MCIRDRLYISRILRILSLYFSARIVSYLFCRFYNKHIRATDVYKRQVYGCNNLMQLEDDLQQIETLRKIDIFDFDSIKNEYLLEDIKKYGKQIY